MVRAPPFRVALGYTALVLLYGWIVATTDWDYYAQKAVERAEMDNSKKQSVDAADKVDEES